jgi:hypothetical protein
MSIRSILRAAYAAPLGALLAGMLIAAPAAALPSSATPAPATVAEAPADDAAFTGAADLLKSITAKTPDASDDFSDVSSGWTVSDSDTRQMGYADGGYHIAVDGTAEPWSFATNGTSVGDGVIQVGAQDQPQSTGHPYGIVVRAQDNSNYHGFIISDDESYAAFHVEEGQFGLDGTAEGQLPAGVFRHDANRIEAVLKGDDIFYFVNGVAIDRATALWQDGEAGVISGNVRAGRSDVLFEHWKMWDAKGDITALAAPPVPPNPATPTVVPPKVEVTIPTIDATNSSMSGDALKTIFTGDLAKHADELAALRADSIHIPELRISYEAPSADGSTIRGLVVFRDIQATNVTGGVAQSLSVASSEVTASDGAAAKFGKMSTGTFDIGGLLGFYGLVKAQPSDALKTIYENLTLAGGTVTTPKLNCAIGPVTAASFKARPLKMPLTDLMALLRMAQTEGDSPSPDTISKLVGFYADLLDAFETSPVEMSGFNCSGTDDNGKPIAINLGSATVGAFAHGVYPQIAMRDLAIAASDGQISLGSLLFKGFDLSGPLAVLKSATGTLDAAWFEAHYRQLIPAFAGWSFANLKVDVPDEKNPRQRINAAVGAFDLTLKKYVNGIPTDISNSASHVVFALPPASGDDTVQKLLALGIDKVDLGYELAANWDEASQEIKISKISLSGAKMGSLLTTAVIGKATQDLFSPDTDAAVAASFGLTLKQVFVDVEDAGLADLVLQRAAKEQGKTVADLRTAVSGFVQGGILVLLGGTDGAKKLSDAVGAFINGAKSLTVTVAAKSPDGLGMEELQQLQANPTSLDSALTIDATAK